jgi:Domain of unknown function (DUF5069)
MEIPGLRSPYETVGGIVYFGRMIDKIRLQASGKLPSAYQAQLGDANSRSFDGRCCRFLHIDEQVLGWAIARGHQPSAEEIEIWNDYLAKRCWRDQFTPRLHVRLQEAGMPTGSVLTMFDFIDLDEGRSAQCNAA